MTPQEVALNGAGHPAGVAGTGRDPSGRAASRRCLQGTFAECAQGQPGLGAELAKGQAEDLGGGVGRAGFHAASLVVVLRQHAGNTRPLALPQARRDCGCMAGCLERMSAGPPVTVARR
jgi:hypothetical protein